MSRYSPCIELTFEVQAGRITLLRPLSIALEAFPCPEFRSATEPLWPTIFGELNGSERSDGRKRAKQRLMSQSVLSSISHGCLALLPRKPSFDVFKIALLQRGSTDSSRVPGRMKEGAHPAIALLPRVCAGGAFRRQAKICSECYQITPSMALSNCPTIPSIE